MSEVTKPIALDETLQRVAGALEYMAEHGGGGGGGEDKSNSLKVDLTDTVGAQFFLKSYINVYEDGVTLNAVIFPVAQATDIKGAIYQYEDGWRVVTGSKNIVGMTWSSVVDWADENSRSLMEGGADISEYIKGASVSGNTLTLTKKDGTKVTYTPDAYTKTEADGKYQPKGNYLTEHQDISHLATKSELATTDEKVTQIGLEVGELATAVEEGVTASAESASQASASASSAEASAEVATSKLTTIQEQIENMTTPEGEVIPANVVAQVASNKAEISELDRRVGGVELSQSNASESAYKFISTQNKWTNDINLGALFYAVKKGDIVDIDANDSFYCMYAWLNSTSTTIVDYMAGETRKQIEVSESARIVAPNDGYLYICNIPATGDLHFPKKAVLIPSESIKYIIDQIKSDSEISDVETTIVQNSYVSATGAITADNRFNRTEPIQVSKGDLLYVSVNYSGTIGVLVFNSTADFTNGIEDIIKKESTGETDFQYLCKKDGYVIVSGGKTDIIVKRKNVLAILDVSEYGHYNVAWTRNKYVDKNTGKLISGDYYYSNVIEIGNHIISALYISCALNRGGSAGVAFFDDNMNYIGGNSDFGVKSAVSTHKIAVPYGAKYFRFTTAIVSGSGVYGDSDERNLVAKSNEHQEYINMMLLRNYNHTYANSVSAINLINYRNNTQNVHPKVLYFENGLFGHKYWMGYTPYPNGDTSYENPCIAYSDDGYMWNDFDNNPLEPKPSGDWHYYNSDTHLVYKDGSLELWWRYCDQADAKEYIYRKVTTDGVSWTAKELLYQSQSEDSGHYASYLCPCAIFDGTKYLIWVVNYRSDSIKYYESNDGKNWVYVRDIQLQYFHNGVEYRAWHMDIIKDGDKYLMVMMAKSKADTNDTRGWVLFYSESEDNTIWTAPKILMLPNEDGWDTGLYRSTIVKVGGEYRLYYSALRDTGTNKIYGIGISIAPKLWKFIGEM